MTVARINKEQLGGPHDGLHYAACASDVGISPLAFILTDKIFVIDGNDQSMMEFCYVNEEEGIKHFSQRFGSHTLTLFND